MDPIQQNHFKKIFILLPIIILLMVFYTWISSPMLLTVDGVGEVSVPATNTTITFAVSANDAMPGNAIAAVKAKVQNIRNFLKNSGISEEDIIESQINVVPATTVITGATGYQATISMGAKTVHVSSAGDLISSLYAKEAVLVSQPVVSVEKQEELEQKAFDEALNDAKKKAGKIALRNWKIFKKIVAVTQASSGTTSTATSKADVLTENQNQVAALNGVFKIVKAVSVTYKMW